MRTRNGQHVPASEYVFAQPLGTRRIGQATIENFFQKRIAAADGVAKGAMAAKGDAPVGSVEEADVVSRLVPDDSLVGKSCPLCGQGIIVKGKAAYGCSRWREGCTFRLPFAHDKA